MQHMKASRPGRGVFTAGLGNAEFSINAYPGICLVGTNCWGNANDQTYQWYQTTDTSPRSVEIYGDDPEPWDFVSHRAAALVIINIGTNDKFTHNNEIGPQFQQSYIELVNSIHQLRPDAQVMLFSLWIGFSAVGPKYTQQGRFVSEILNVYQHFASEGFVSCLYTTGMLQHNDIGPQYHPTDVGHIKLASHLLQYVKLELGWDLEASGVEVQSKTLYWNDQSSY